MSRSDLINPRRMLPDVTLPDSGGAARRVRARGDRSVLLALVHGGCEECRAWVAKLADEGAEIMAWRGEVKVVAPRVAEYPFPVLLDADARLAALVGVAVPAVVIADQWGAIHEATEGHEFIPIESVVEWIRYLATECPECEGEAY
ncbi:MAG TPA: hypothetical protein VGE86_05230 [Thermoanaerobaculia bacterium]